MRHMILNSKQALPESGTLAVQISPEGEFPGVKHLADGKKVKFVQRLDKAAFERIINAWEASGREEILVDADHTSVDGGATTAYAWAGNLRHEEGRGLVGDFTFTERGRKAIESREFRFVSPVFTIAKNGDITELDSIALTNRPNLPVSCVLNRTEPDDTTVQENKETPMDKVINALGLAAGASEDAVVEAINSLKAAKAASDAALVKNEAEAFADANKDRVENREALVELYVKNGKDVAMAFLAALKAPSKASETPAQVVLNGKEGTAPVVKNARETLASLPIKERAAYFREHEADFAK